MRSTLVLVALGLLWNTGLLAQDLVIRNARIIDGTGRTIDSGSIVIRGDRILAVNESGVVGNFATQINAQGMTVMPGLTDTHVHLLTYGATGATSVEPASPSPAELEGYLGTYFSEELDYEQVLRITNDGLSMWDPRTWGEFALTPFGRDVFRLRWWALLTFSRDGQGRVVGFTLDTSGMRNLKFVRR